MPAPPIDQAARQQLDELDALLQRMLASDDPPPAAPPPPPRPPAPVLNTTPNRPDYQTWVIDLNPRDGSSVLGNRGGVALTPPPRATPTGPTPEEVSAVGLAWAAQPLPAVPVEPVSPPQPLPVPLPPMPPPPLPLALWPWAAVTFLYDGPTYLLGPLGRPLRGPVCKNLLGASGVAMMLLAVAWSALEWYGWPW